MTGDGQNETNDDATVATRRLKLKQSYSLSAGTPLVSSLVSSPVSSLFISARPSAHAPSHLVLPLVTRLAIVSRLATLVSRLALVSQLADARLSARVPSRLALKVGDEYTY